MRSRICALILVVAALALPASGQYLFRAWSISEFQPDIPQGGRANTISVHPANRDIMLVTSETGGLFRTNDRGITWRHVDALPVFSTPAVAWVPANPSVVIATAGEDFRTSNGGGIWRSADGGASWTQLPGPPAPAGVTSLLSAYEISIAPDSGKIYVGTTYGVSISADQGVTWNHVSPFPAGDRRVFAVLAQSGNRILAGGPAGIRWSADGGMSWFASTSGTGGANIADLHAFGASPFDSLQAYAVNGLTQLYYTVNGGNHWTQISSAPAGGGGCGGIAFVKAVGRTRRHWFLPPQRSVILYAGNRCGLARLEAPQAGWFSSSFNYSGSWTGLTIDHADTRDLAFDPSGAPLLLATDGGVHKPDATGMNWTLTGGGRNGYNALQITEVKGQWITSLGLHDLYFGTQDNDLRASGDDGVTWAPRVCCEGFFIEQQHRVAVPADSKTTFVSCGPCNNLQANRLFSSVAGWPNPYNPAQGNPAMVRQSFHVQGVNTPAVPAAGLSATVNLGASWQSYAAFPEARRDLPKLTDPGSLPVLYQSIRTGWNATLNLEINQLARIVRNATGPGASVTYPLMNNFGGLGINPTMFAWYQVFAVDPGNSMHLIAPDVVNAKMMETWDGGNNWSEIPALTSLVTDGGNLLFRKRIFPQASAVSFSPDDPNLVAVGTWQGGIFVSGNRGATWSKVPDSEPVTYITSVEWRTAGDAIVSTYGRGLWRLQWRLILPRLDFERYCRICRYLPIPPLLDLREPFERAVLVFRGRVQGARIANGLLEELFVSPGSSTVFFMDSQRFRDIKVTETKEKIGITGTGGQGRVDPGLVGFAMAGDGKLLSSILSEDELLLYEPTERERTQDQELVGRRESPISRQPYVRLEIPGGSAANRVVAGEKIEVTARGFRPGALLFVSVDDRVVERVTADENGGFSVRIEAPREFGLKSLTVREPNGPVIDGVMFLVVHEDRERD